MQTVGVLSRKGGVGKTTLATHLAVLVEEAGLRPLLIDLDPQKSAASWWRAREASTPQLVETRAGRLKEVLAAAAKDGVDVAVVDARPWVAADVGHVATLADLVIVPTRPTIFDLRAILQTLDGVKAATRRAVIVLNACPPHRGAGEASVVVDARHALAAFGVPVAPVPIVHRAAFPAAALTGLAVTEFDPAGKAAREVRALWRVVEKELGINGSKGKAINGGRTGKRTGREAGKGRSADRVGNSSASQEGSRA